MDATNEQSEHRETKTNFLRSCPVCYNDLDEDDVRICKTCVQELEAGR